MLYKSLVILFLSVCFIVPVQAQFLLVENGDGAFPTIQFQEADGLQSETQSIESRHSGSSIFYPVKMPGLGRVGNITLRSGIVMNDAKFWDFYKQITMNSIGRATLVLHGPKGMMFTLHNAWPTKITGTNLSGKDGDSVSIDAMEIAYESLSISFN